MPIPYSLRVDNDVDRIIGGIQSWGGDENKLLLDAIKFARRSGFFREAKKKYMAAEKAAEKKRVAKAQKIIAAPTSFVGPPFLPWSPGA